MKVKLTGWQAVLAVVALAGFALFRLTTQNEALQAEGFEVVQSWLQQEHARTVLPEMQSAMKDPSANKDALEKAAKSLTETAFEVLSITRHGRGEKIVARVELKSGDSTAPKETSIRYLRMEYGIMTGWRVLRETSSFSYYLAAF